MKARREKHVTECAERRATRAAAHKTAVDEAIIGGLHDARAADCPDEEYHDLADRLMEDAQEYLGDADEMRGYLDRPVGETVAKLCAALGLDPKPARPTAPPGASAAHRWISKPGSKKKPKSMVFLPPSPEVGRVRMRSIQGGELSPRHRTPVITPHSPTLTAEPVLRRALRTNRGPSVHPHKGEGGRVCLLHHLSYIPCATTPAATRGRPMKTIAFIRVRAETVDDLDHVGGGHFGGPWLVWLRRRCTVAVSGWIEPHRFSIK